MKTSSVVGISYSDSSNSSRNELEEARAIARAWYVMFAALLRII